jgi:hypothetical protein
VGKTSSAYRILGKNSLGKRLLVNNKEEILRTKVVRIAGDVNYWFRIVPSGGFYGSSAVDPSSYFATLVDTQVGTIHNGARRNHNAGSRWVTSLCHPNRLKSSAYHTCYEL